ncbi:11092_t:CDS:2 [Diversispora eburnea]|uniref:11092_t:CDS:1 n=1 Tax=Diversispora eburnea TaxID=1213867 RepID=A0A9N8Z000_9GLOM|nr:11092_t:CDS:2 [Diversispora eburnea]
MTTDTAEKEVTTTSPIELEKKNTETTDDKTTQAPPVPSKDKDEVPPVEPTETAKPTANDLILKGMLEKRAPPGSFMRNWKKRYFVIGDEKDIYTLENLRLYYKKNLGKTPHVASKVVNNTVETSQPDIKEVKENGSPSPKHVLATNCAHATKTGKGLLYYFRSKSKEHLKEPHGIINLKDVKDVISLTSIGGKDNCFKIITEHREYELHAENELTKERWINTIKEKAEEAKNNPIVEDEGYQAVFNQVVVGRIEKESVASDSENCTSGEEDETKRVHGRKYWFFNKKTETTPLTNTTAITEITETGENADTTATTEETTTTRSAEDTKHEEEHHKKGKLFNVNINIFKKTTEKAEVKTGDEIKPEETKEIKETNETSDADTSTAAETSTQADKIEESREEKTPTDEQATTEVSSEQIENVTETMKPPLVPLKLKPKKTEKTEDVTDTVTKTETPDVTNETVETETRETKETDENTHSKSHGFLGFFSKGKEKADTKVETVEETQVEVVKEEVKEEKDVKEEVKEVKIEEPEGHSSTTKKSGGNKVMRRITQVFKRKEIINRETSEDSTTEEKVDDSTAPKVEESTTDKVTEVKEEITELTVETEEKKTEEKKPEEKKPEEKKPEEKKPEEKKQQFFKRMSKRQPSQTDDIKTTEKVEVTTKELTVESAVEATDADDIPGESENVILKEIPDSIKHGRLQKRRGLIPQFTQIYLVFTKEGKLNYYPSEKSTSDCKSIEIKKDTHIKEIEGMKPLFEIETKSKTHKFLATSVEERKEWIKVLEEYKKALPEPEEDRCIKINELKVPTSTGESMLEEVVGAADVAATTVADTTVVTETEEKKVGNTVEKTVEETVESTVEATAEKTVEETAEAIVEEKTVETTVEGKSGEEKPVEAVVEL